MSRKVQSETSKLFDPDTSFFKLPIVWITVTVIVVLATLLAGLIVMWSGPLLSDNRNYEGINELVAIFQLPLGLLALLIPVLAVYATNHRSEQNLAAMRLTRVQNDFANYYKHLEEFAKFIEPIASEFGVTFSARKLHKRLYPEAKQGNLGMSSEFEELLLGDVKCVLENLQDLFANHEAQERAKLRLNLNGALDIVFSHVNSCIIKGNRVAGRFNSQGNYHVSISVHELLGLNYLYRVTEVMERVVQFDVDYVSALPRAVRELEIRAAYMDDLATNYPN